jgi:hypothetical protein
MFDSNLVPNDFFYREGVSLSKRSYSFLPEYTTDFPMGSWSLLFQIPHYLLVEHEHLHVQNATLYVISPKIIVTSKRSSSITAARND